MGEPRSVPAGQYGEQVFKNLGIWELLRPKFVFGNSVRNVLGTVESGNADAGIVYVTDVQSTEKVTPVATAPEQLHDPIIYPLAIVSASRHQTTAQTYIKFLRSSQAISVFRQYGFGIAER
jgi:molybdate transport system substrate-binding protein